MTKNNIKRYTIIFYVRGMHCASCKSIIEDRLTQRTDIDTAEVRLNDETVTILCTKKNIDADILTEVFSDVGYVFSTEPFKKSSYKKIIISLIVAVIIFFLLLQSQKFMFLSNISIDENSSMIAIIMLGVVASLSSCVALVGGILLSMTKNWAQTSKNISFAQKMEPHMKFHIGRLLAYFLGGGFLGTLGNFITFNDPTIYGVLIFLIAFLMIFIGLQMIGVRWVVRTYGGIYEKIFKKIHITNDIKNKSPLIIGAATFFLPCGFTLIAQGVALTTSSFMEGAAVMGAFAIGTFPVLVGISFGGVAIVGKKGFEQIFNVIIGTVIIVFALYTINGQLNALGLPSFSDVRMSNTKQKMNVLDEKNKIGNMQELHVTADGFSYTIIGSNELKAGVPTKIIVDNKGISGCGVFMAARGLFDGRIELEPGINEKEFIPKSGTYKLTCTMGMVPPVTIIVK